MVENPIIGKYYIVNCYYTWRNVKTPIIAQVLDKEGDRVRIKFNAPNTVTHGISREGLGEITWRKVKCRTSYPKWLIS